MPLTRYQIRNEFGLADMEMYGAADKDDPEALLEGIAMAGLVGVLRQLGDLAEFAAEIFHYLHEELMATAARGHDLVIRVQQLEAGAPSMEKAVLSQTHHSSFFSDPGSDWHPNLQTEKNLITLGELPHCIRDSYEECRGPPRLFLLDKFDVAGAGACLKRYSDPSLFKMQTASSAVATSELGKEKRARKLKKKGSHWRNGDTPEVAPTSHAKLHQLFLMEHVDRGDGDPVFHMKLKRRQLNGSPVNSSSGRSYMEKLLQSPFPEREKVPGFYSKPRLLTLRNENSGESGAEVTEISAVKAAEKPCQAKETEVTVCNEQEVLPAPSMVYLNGGDTVKDMEMEPDPVDDDETVKIPSTRRERMIKEKPFANLEKGPANCLDIASSGDLTCRVDNYADILASMESETTETEDDYKSRNNLGPLGVGKPQIYSDADENREEVPSQFSDNRSIGHTSMLDVVHHSFEEEVSDILYTGIPSPSPETKPPNVEGSDETVDIQSSQLAANKDSVGTGTSGLVLLNGQGAAKSGIHEHEETPGLSCCENLRHLPQDPAICMTSGPEKLLANEIGMTLSETSAILGVHSDSRDSLLDTPSEAHSVCLSKLPCVAPEAEGSKNEVLQTNSTDDCQTENITNMETESVISFSVLMEEQFSCLTSQEMEVLSGTSLFLRGSEIVKPKDICSEADVPISAAEISSGHITLVEVKLENILPAEDVGTTSFEDLSPIAILADKNVPEEDEVNLENISSMDTKAENQISPFNIGLENSTILPDIPRNFQTGIEHLSASSHKDLSVDTDQAGKAPLYEQEALQPVSIFADDTKHGESLAKGNEVKGNADDAGPNNRTGLDNIAIETMYEGESRNSDDDMFCVHLDSISFPQESQLGIQECLLQHQEELEQTNTLSSKYCSRSQDQGQVNLSEPASADLNPYDVSAQEVFVDLQDSSPAEPSRLSSKRGHLGSETVCMLQNKHVHGSEKTLPLVACYPQGYKSKRLPELEALHAEHLPALESSISLNDRSEPMLSADHTEQGKCLDTSPETILPSFGSLKEAAQAGPEEMPPLPPLPPMQWWIAKPQPAVHDTLNESIKMTEAPFLSIASLAPGGKSSVNLTAAHRDICLPTGENTVEAVSTAGLTLPAVKHVAVDQSEPGTGFEGKALEHFLQNSGEGLDHSSEISVLGRAEVEEKPQLAPSGSDGETKPSNSPPHNVLTSSSAGKSLPVNSFAPPRNLGDENACENSTTGKLPRPDVSLGDAVPAIDRSMLRKVSERVRPPIEPNVDEKDSLLELIRNKSFNLRPAVASTRPNVQVAPKTNLKVAAILEKANTLRQAMAGSDDDDDDSWSDT